MSTRAPRCSVSVPCLIGLAFVLAMLPPTSAQADTIIVTFNADTSSSSGDLVPPLPFGTSITGRFEIDDGVVGSFTPSGNPTFLQSEMRYAGALTSAELIVGGDLISGSGGDVVLLDSAGNLSGDDYYRIEASIDTGSVGGVATISFDFIAEYDFGTFTISSGDALGPPPPIDPTSFNTFLLTSATGGTGTGRVTGFSVEGPPAAVPLGSPLALGLITLGSIGMGMRSLGAMRLKRIL